MLCIFSLMSAVLSQYGMYVSSTVRTDPGPALTGPGPGPHWPRSRVSLARVPGPNRGPGIRLVLRIRLGRLFVYPIGIIIINIINIAIISIPYSLFPIPYWLFLIGYSLLGVHSYC